MAAVTATLKGKLRPFAETSARAGTIQQDAIAPTTAKEAQRGKRTGNLVFVVVGLLKATQARRGAVIMPCRRNGQRD
jgi:hypothetical protein